MRAPPPGPRALRPAADRDAAALAAPRRRLAAVASPAAATAIAIAADADGTATRDPHGDGRQRHGADAAPSSRQSRLVVWPRGADRLDDRARLGAEGRAAATRPSRSRQRARTRRPAARRRARLVALREPPPRLLDDVHRACTRARRTRPARSGAPAPRSRARASSGSSRVASGIRSADRRRQRPIASVVSN